jgi:hypothetical protein
MANIRLKELLEANVDPKLVARSKETGKLVYFKNAQNKDAAMKAGTHLDPKDKKGGEPKADANPNDMFGKDYKKDRGSKEAPKSNTNWMDDLDSIDTSDVKGKADPSADSWTHGDVFGATFKDPQTGKPISVGDAYDREDDSPAYQKAFAYVAQFNPDDEAVMGTQAYADLNKKAGKSNYDDKSYWKDDERSNTQGYTGDDDDSEDDNSWGDEAQFTSDRLSKIEDALKDDLNLRGNGFETTRESGGGMGGFEGPMTIISKDVDYNDEDNYISLSVGSPNNDGKFSIVFANANGEPYFEPNYDALTGDNDLEPQQAYKVTKALMKMPEVQKLLKGKMSRDVFKPIYDKLKSKFSKTESTKLTSMIKK